LMAAGSPSGPDASLTDPQSAILSVTRRFSWRVHCYIGTHQMIFTRIGWKRGKCPQLRSLCSLVAKGSILAVISKLGTHYHARFGGRARRLSEGNRRRMRIELDHLVCLAPVRGAFAGGHPATAPGASRVLALVFLCRSSIRSLARPVPWLG